MTKLVEDRFREKIAISPTTECWVWQGSRSPFGYGLFRYGGGCRLAHRASWELHAGAIPGGMCVLHKCDNPSCVNPAHLFLGTIADNNRDMIRKGRFRAGGPAGEKCGKAKLSNVDVAEIREYARKYSGYALTLAPKYGVTPRTIYRVVSGVNYRPASQ